MEPLGCANLTPPQSVHYPTSCREQTRFLFALWALPFLLAGNHVWERADCGKLAYLCVRKGVPMRWVAIVGDVVILAT